MREADEASGVPASGGASYTCFVASARASSRAHTCFVASEGAPTGRSAAPMGAVPGESPS